MRSGALFRPCVDDFSFTPKAASVPRPTIDAMGRKADMDLKVRSATEMGTSTRHSGEIAD
jgi:hypothetical protein